MEPEGSLQHSRAPATCPYLTICYILYIYSLSVHVYSISSSSSPTLCAILFVWVSHLHFILRNTFPKSVN
jgi:hypothetical protein